MISLDSPLGDTDGRRPQIGPPNRPMPRPRKFIGPSSQELLPPESKVEEAKQAEAKDSPRGLALSREIPSVPSLYQSLTSTTLRNVDVARTEHLKEGPSISKA